MKRSFLFTVAIISAGFSTVVSAQENRQETTQTSQKQKPTPKSRKVWTEDDVSKLRGPEDTKTPAEQTGPTEAAQKTGAAPSQAGAPPAKSTAPPALSNPKTIESADKMIAWEDRDIAAQQEFVERLQKQLEEAPPEDQERLQNLLKERQRIIVDTQKERQILLDQRKALEKKATETKSGPQS